MKPVAIPPAVAASDDRSPVPSSLTGRLKTISARMSDSSSGGLLVSASSGALTRAGDLHLGLDAGVRDHPRRSDVEERIDLRLAHETDASAALQIEPTALELVGAAHGLDRPEQDRPVVRRLDDLHLAADGDVDVAERRAGRAARPDALAAQHEVVGQDQPDIEFDGVERAGRRGSLPGFGLRSARSSS